MNWRYKTTETSRDGAKKVRRFLTKRGAVRHLRRWQGDHPITLVETYDGEPTGIVHPTVHPTRGQIRTVREAAARRHAQERDEDADG